MDNTPVTSVLFVLPIKHLKIVAIELSIELCLIKIVAAAAADLGHKVRKLGEPFICTLLKKFNGDNAPPVKVAKRAADTMALLSFDLGI